MASLENIRRRLGERITSTGHTFREISLKIGRKDSYIQQFVKYGFPKRLNEVDRKRICLLLGMDEHELIDDDLVYNSASIPALVNTRKRNSTGQNYINIDVTEASGNLLDSRNIIGKMALNYKDFNQFLGSNAPNLSAIRIKNDSMFPTLPTDTLIFYAENIKEYNGEGIYIIEYHDSIQIKRIQQTGSNKYVLMSDNKLYHDIECTTNDFIIIGKATSYLVPHIL